MQRGSVGSNERGLLAAFLAAVLVVGAAGCSSGNGGDGSQEGAASGVATTEPVTTTEAPPVSVPDPVDLPIEEVSGRALATLTIPSPSWLAVDDEAVYVRRDDGVVSSIDPDTNDVTTLAEIPGDLCQGIGVGFGAVWTCSDTDVVAIDLATGAVGDPIAVGKAATQGHLGVGHDRVWVLVGDGSELVGIDPETSEPDPPITLGIRGTDVAVDDEGVWVASAVDDAVVRVAPDAAAVDLAVGGLGGASAIAFTEGTAWAAGSTGTFPIDTETGDVGEPVAGGAGPDGAIAATGQSLWVRRADTFLQEIDVTDGAVGEITADVTSGGDVIVAFDSLWATAYDDSVTYRLALD